MDIKLCFEKWLETLEAKHLPLAPQMPGYENILTDSCLFGFLLVKRRLHVGVVGEGLHFFFSKSTQNYVNLVSTALLVKYPVSLDCCGQNLILILYL